MCSMKTLLKLYVRPRADGAQSFVRNIRNEGLVAFFFTNLLLRLQPPQAARSSCFLRSFKDGPLACVPVKRQLPFADPKPV